MRPSRLSVQRVAGTRVAIAVAVVVAASCGTSSNRVVEPPVAQSPLEFREVLATFPCPGAHTTTTAPMTIPPPSVVRADTTTKTCYALGPSLLPGANVAGAQVERNDNSGTWEVNVHFGNDDFVREVATPYVGKQIAIVLDTVVQSAPTINEGITGRDITISGAFEEATARRVAKEIAPPGTSIDAPTSTTTPLDAMRTTYLERCRAVAPRLGWDPNDVSGSSMTIRTMRAAYEHARQAFPPDLAQYDDAERLAVCVLVPTTTLPPPADSPTTVCPNGDVVDTGGLTATGTEVQYAVDAHLSPTKLPEIKYFLPEGVTVPAQVDPCTVFSH